MARKKPTKKKSVTTGNVKGVHAKSSPKKTSPKKTTRKKAAKTVDNMTTEEKARGGYNQREMSAKYRQRTQQAIRDITDGWEEASSKIDWDTRLATQKDLKLFCETYIAPVFYFGWSNDQLKCIRKIESVFIEDNGSGMFCLAMPRGGGKTALCRAGMLWGTAHAHKVFPYFVGSTQPKSTQTLDFIKTYWYRNKRLRQDFPELGYPFYRLENRFHLARGQTFNGESTHIEYGSDEVTYPCLLFTEEQVAGYLKHDPNFITYLKDYDRYIARSAGVNIGTAGIDGSIRGEAEVHPILLTQPRPDVVLLDDIQKDQKAESPASVAKLIRLIDGCVQGLAGPGQHISALMPCTVIQENDVADTYLDRERKPEWKGERCKMVLSWPEGIDDYQITLDTNAGKHWNQYNDERIKSLRLYEDWRLATQYYSKHRDEMDRDFTVSWEERFDPKTELSAQQHAMNLRLKNPEAFPPEYQQIGRSEVDWSSIMITAKQLTERVVKGCPEFHVLPETHTITAFIDVQNEILFFSTLAVDLNYTGVIPHYGTFPKINSRSFYKNNTEGWAMLSKEFFKAHPEQKALAKRDSGKKPRAPLEAKIYHALGEAVRYLRSLEFPKQDAHNTVMKIGPIAIDTRWGQVSDAIKRFCRECGDPEVYPYFGHGLTPAHKQYEEYDRGGSAKGWMFEDSLHPQVKEVKWIYKPDAVGQYYFLADVNRLKTFLMSRLSSPLGSSGNIMLYDAPPDHHLRFAQHVCESEYPEPTMARGIEKDMWQHREARPDNDWLDTVVGNLVLTSFKGAWLKTSQGQTKIKRAPRRLSDKFKDKKRR